MTTRRLLLVRHSKAAPGAVDAERPLTSRGAGDAAAIGEWISRLPFVPDQVMVSPARRAGETWVHAAAALPEAAQAVVDDRIYANTLDALLTVIHETPAEVQTFVVVGHNPSIAELANTLDDGHGDAGTRRALARGYPTSGVAVFTVHTPWPHVEAASATLTHFHAPHRGQISLHLAHSLARAYMATF